MIKLIIAILGLLSLGTDLIVYHQLSKRFTERKWVKKTYLISFIAIDAVIIAALVLLRSSVATTGNMLAIMWIIWGFIAFTVPKQVYLIVSCPDYFIRKYTSVRRRIFTTIGFGAALAVFGLIIWGATGGRNILREVNVTIGSDALPHSFDGYRIAQISDIHLGNYSKGNDIVERLVEMVNALDADLIVFSGDLVNTNVNEFTQRYMDILSGLKSRDGVYAVLGNHDLGIYVFDNKISPEENIAMLSQKIEQMGWHLIENRSVYITRGNDSISLTGVGYPADGGHNGIGNIGSLSKCDFNEAYRDTDSSKFNILISHTPAVWDEVVAKGYADLTLSGHVHAMQFKVNLFGRSWSPAQWMYPRWTGLYEENGQYLYINDGIGFVMYPMRIGTRPEITVLTLKHEPQK